MTSPRLAAARTLLAVDRGLATLGAALERARMPVTEARDRALAGELAIGVLRWRAALDAVLQAHSRRPLESLPPETRAVLRLGAYQLRYLDRVPGHAAVFESVELTRALGEPRASGFVNAVLRRVASHRGAPELPVRPDDDAGTEAWLPYLTTTLSHPAWLVRRWIARVGIAATEAWCTFNNAAPDVVVRVRPPASPASVRSALETLGLSASPAPYAPDALRLTPGTLGRLPADLTASVTIQDEGAQLVARALGAEPGERVLDVCASPGGKTEILLEHTGMAGLVVASDFRPARVRLLARRLKNRTPGAALVRLDARRPLPFRADFDAVLLDAPCSGLGTIRRDPDVKWARAEGDLAGFARTQSDMLMSAAGGVRPGGRLLYATCSSEPEENEAVVEGFLAAHPGFRRVPVRLPGPPAGLTTAAGELCTLPFRDGLDAYYGALLERPASA